MSSREEIILEILHKEKHIKVTDVANSLKVTPETIRKDFDDMESRGLLKRVHGGAVVPNYSQVIESNFADRSGKQYEEKRKLAQAVADNLVENESIILDNGSTCYELAKIIAPRSDLTVITPSLNIASVLNKGGCKVFVLGGWLRKTESSVIGDSVVKEMKKFNVSKSILSIAGINEEAGLSEFVEEDASIKKQAIKCGAKTIVMADSTKFDVNALITVAHMDEIDEIYTDNALSDERVKAFEEKGVKVIRV